MDDQTIKLGFQVDTSQVTEAVKASAQVKAAIADVDDANEKASANAAARAQRDADKAAASAQKAADAAAREAQRKADQVQAIEDKFFMREYARQVKREQDAEKSEKKRVEDAWTAWARQDEAAEKSADKQEKATKRVKQGVAGMGQSFLQTGRIVQDFAQGGIGGVLNNIEGLVMALGLSGGLAGVLTIVGVAFMLLKPQIMAFVESLDFGQIEKFKGGLESLKEQLKTLEDKKIRLPVEDADLKRLKDQIDDIIKATEYYQRLITKQTKHEAASGRNFEDTVVETDGARKAIDRERQARADRAISESKTVQEIEAKIAEFENRAAGYDRSNLPGAHNAALLARESANTLRPELAAEKQKVAEAADAEFKKIELSGAQGQGDVQARAQEMIAKILENAGLKEAADDIRAHSAKAFKAGTTPEEEVAASERIAAKSAAESEAELKRMKEQDKFDEAARKSREDIAHEEAKEDAKTGKALGRAPKTEAELAKDEKADDKERMDAAKRKADREKELSGLALPNGANIADVYAQERMRIDMLPKNQQGRARAALDQDTQSAVQGALARKGDLAAGLKSSIAPSDLDAMYQRFRGLNARQTAAARPKRQVGKGKLAAKAKGVAKGVAAQKVKPGGGKAAADDKSVSLLQSVDKSLARIEANTADALRASNIAVLG